LFIPKVKNVRVDVRGRPRCTFRSVHNVDLVAGGRTSSTFAMTVMGNVEVDAAEVTRSTLRHSPPPQCLQLTYKQR